MLRWWLCLGILFLPLVACSPRVSSSAYPLVSAVDVSQARRFDPEAGECGVIRYTLSAPALVRIRIVDADTPGIILRTLIDWEPRSVGVQEERWDGLDRHGQRVDARRVSFLIRAEPRREQSVEARDALLALPYPEEKHFAHPSEQCRDLGVRLLVPTARVVSGPMSVEVAVTGPEGMPDGEYHVVLYLDGRAIWDGRVEEPRFSQVFDTANIPDGEHWLAVTFNDLHDHAGSDWVLIEVRNN